MSTRSGKRIHTSLLEDTAATEVEPVAKTERKTRSKLVKENIDELSVSIFKNKKRNNYVSYPIDDEPLGDTATKRAGEAKLSRAIRKNALKDRHNSVENSDQLESQTEAKSLTRKSRRFKRVEDAEVTENDENVPVEVTEVSKTKKGKKKKKVEAIVVNPIEEHHQVSDEAPAKKSKKKKKKGKRSCSTIVEDVPQNNDSKNRSINSVDSFHSAAGSPYKTETIDAVPDDKLDNTFEKTEDIMTPSKTNQKKNKKVSNNNNFDNSDKSVNVEVDKLDENKKYNKSTKKRKPVSDETGLKQCFVSVARDNLEKDLEDIFLSHGHLRRKSNTRDATVDKSNISSNLGKDVDTNSDVYNMSKRQSKRRKSSIKEANEVSLPANKLGDENYVKNNETFDKELRSRNSFVKDVTFDKSNASIVKEIFDSKDVLDDSNIAKNHLKTRRSMIKDSTFDKSNTSIVKEIVENSFDVDNLDVTNKHPKTRRSVIKDSTFDKSNACIAKELFENSVVVDDFNNFKNQLKTRKSVIKDSTFDKSNTTIVKEIVESNADVDVSSISNNKLKTRRSFIKDSTFDKSNASIAKEEPAEEIDLNNSTRLNSKARKSILKDSTFDKSNASITNGNIEKDTEPYLNVSNKQLRRRKSYIKDTTFEKQDSVLNTTFEKEAENGKETVKKSPFNKSNSKHLDATDEQDVETDTSTSKKKEKKSSADTTYEKTDKDATFEKDTSSSFDAFKKGANNRKSSIRDASFDTSNFSIASLNKEDFEKDNNIILSSSATKRRSIRCTVDKNDTISENVNTTYEKTENTDHELKRKSTRLSKTPDIQTALNTTFEKKNTNEVKENLISSSKSSLISSDNSSVADKSDISRISITSDDSSEHAENIINTTPLLIESSIDESYVAMTKPESPKPQTPLKREGTFTKEVLEQPEAEVETPTKHKSVPTAGCTPFHVGKSSQKKTMLNVTRSLEKGVRASVDPAPRLTRVMFCSPVDNPATFTQEKRKIIKSNLKGSNKSFVFDENASMSRPARKRSYTQNDADDSRVKRTRLTEDLQHSVDRLSRPRTASATAKLVVTPKKPTTPSKSKSEGKPSRTKLPNFAAMHQKEFDKMESLDECQERRAKRARQLLTPTAPPGLLDRISPKNTTESPKKSKELAKPKEKIDTPTKKTDTPTKKLPTLEPLRPGFTRFGFKLNLEVNPFSIPSKTVEKPKEKPVEKPNGTVPRAGILPSLAGATSARREVAKLTVMREKSFTDRRNVTRNENRTVIKGVRTNRRFELQMKMRNID